MKTLFIFLLILFTFHSIFSQTDRFHPKEKEIMEYNKEDYPDRTRQGGDTCSSPTVISSLPYSDTGTTAGYTDDYDEICPFDTPGSPDVVYEYTPTVDEYLDITLCNDATDYDTKIYVYDNT